MYLMGVMGHLQGRGHDPPSGALVLRCGRRHARRFVGRRVAGHRPLLQRSATQVSVAPAVTVPVGWSAWIIHGGCVSGRIQARRDLIIPICRTALLAIAAVCSSRCHSTPRGWSPGPTSASAVQRDAACWKRSLTQVAGSASSRAGMLLSRSPSLSSPSKTSGASHMTSCSGSTVSTWRPTPRWTPRSTARWASYVDPRRHPGARSASSR